MRQLYPLRSGDELKASIEVVHSILAQVVLVFQRLRAKKNVEASSQATIDDVHVDC